jgi:hypothetical protein
MNIEDWAKGQGYTPFPAKPPETLQLRPRIDYPNLDQVSHFAVKSTS